jgi:hypothetical protein
VPDRPVGLRIPVVFNEHAIAEDLAHHPAVARHALELLRRELDRGGGLLVARLKRCEAEGRDGTRLAGGEGSLDISSWPAGEQRETVDVTDPRFPPVCDP